MLHSTLTYTTRRMCKVGKGPFAQISWAQFEKEQNIY